MLSNDFTVAFLVSMAKRIVIELSCKCGSSNSLRLQFFLYLFDLFYFADTNIDLVKGKTWQEGKYLEDKYKIFTYRQTKKTILDKFLSLASLLSISK